MRQMGLDYDASKSTVCDSVKWVETVLGKWNKIQLSDIKMEIEKAEVDGIKVTTIIGDVEEQPIERLTVNQEDSYSGKKKRHTIKNQIIINENGNRILNWDNSIGKIHDYQMIKETYVNVNMELKIFKIMKEIYRNHMNRYNIKVMIKRIAFRAGLIFILLSYIVKNKKIV